MRVAVTGAAGFVGTNLLHELVAQGNEVVAIDRVTSALAPETGIEWVQGDILDTDSMAKSFEGVEVVYHLVAMITLKQEDPLAWRVNTEGVGSVASAALQAGVRRFVHCSSVHSFDQHDCGDFLTEESPRSTEDCGLPVYDRSKYAGELELHKRIDDGLDAVICNPTGVYGWRDHVTHLSRLNQMAYDSARGRVPLSVGSGFNLVDVRDVAKGLTLAAEKGRTGENYLLPGEMVMLHDLMKGAAKEAGKFGPLFPVPLWLLKSIMPLAEPIAAMAGSDIMSEAALGSLFAQPDVTGAKARKELGYTSRPASETIHDFITEAL